MEHMEHMTALPTRTHACTHTVFYLLFDSVGIHYDILTETPSIVAPGKNCVRVPSCCVVLYHRVPSCAIVCHLFPLVTHTVAPSMVQTKCTTN